MKTQEEVLKKLNESLAEVKEHIETFHKLEQEQGQLDEYSKEILFCLEKREVLIKSDIDRLENPEKYTKEKP